MLLHGSLLLKAKIAWQQLMLARAQKSIRRTNEINITERHAENCKETLFKKKKTSKKRMI
jgi:hypothetical protein